MGSVQFRNDVGKLIKARVEGDDFDPFEIEYQAPDAAAYLESDFMRAGDGIAKAILWLTSECLRTWTLSEPLPVDADGRRKALSSLHPHSALLAIYLVLRERGSGALKNC